MRRDERLPVLLNCLAAVALLGLIGAFSLETGLAPPPALAALEPPQHELKQAPPEQAAVALPGQAAPSPSPNPAAAPAASAAGAGAAATTRQCYQLTQTPDPQSPPCRQGWDPSRQDNGGATAAGVTRSAIYVVYPCVAGLYERCQDLPYLQQFFNTHFEFWGRQLKLLAPWCPPLNNSDSHCAAPPGSDGTVAKMQQDASTAAHANDGGGGVFASLSYFPVQGIEHYYYDTLASQYHVVSVSSVPNSETESHYQQFDPYEWAVTPTVDLAEQNLGQFLCRTMAGRAPRWAAGSPRWTPPGQRTFGIVWSRNPDQSDPDLASLTDVLQGCSAPFRTAQFDGSSAAATTLAAQLEQQGVTTVACVCGAGIFKTALAGAADQQGYRPEWIAWPFGFQDTDTDYYQYGGVSGSTAQQWPSDQQGQVIGFSDFNKILPPDEEFWFQAIREGDPGYQYGDNGSDIYDYYRYEELMVLATGIQMAGPHLTAQTFAAALERYPARDPGHGQPPYYQALVGFTSGHGWIQDFAPVYWNANAQNYFTNEPRTGSLCYVTDGGSGPGVRFGLDQWPDRELAFYPGVGAACR